MNASDIARRITDVLQLDTPPIAISFVDEAPAGMPGPASESPSACGFWRQAETRAFYASAEQHGNCPVGMMVMGFELPATTKAELGGLVEDMCANRYLSADEPGQIAAMPRPSAGIVYAPLAQSEGTPDVALLWVDARQAMLCNEAMGTANWGTGSPVVTGRPGCGALPLSVRSDAPVMSLGCAGMRTFTEIADSHFMIAVPGTELTRFTEAAEQVGHANEHMLGFYESRRAQLGHD
jgi:uncharacterized protein (DUF169 family)